MKRWMSTLKLLLALFLLEATGFPLHASATTMFYGPNEGANDLTAFLTAGGCAPAVQGCPSGQLDFESFEAIAVTNTRTANPIMTDLFTINATSPTVQGIFDTVSGQGPFDGSRYVSTFAGATGTVEVTFVFTQAVNTFGLTISDFEVTGDLVLSGDLVGGGTVDFTCATNPGDGGDSSDIFCGMISDTPFEQVVLSTTAMGDTLGIDAVYTPEPGTGFLVAAGLLGLALRSPSSRRAKTCQTA